MDGEVAYETLDETLAKLKANTELCSHFDFHAAGITLTVHYAGEEQWHMLTRSKTRTIDVALLTEAELRFRMDAAQVIDGIAADVRAKRAAPSLTSDLEAHLAAEAQK